MPGPAGKHTERWLGDHGGSEERTVSSPCFREKGCSAGMYAAEGQEDEKRKGAFTGELSEGSCRAGGEMRRWKVTGDGQGRDTGGECERPFEKSGQ